MKKEETARCPLCGNYDVYVGATAIECGYNKNCRNWTKKQAEVVQEIIKKREEASRLLKNDLDWDDDEEDTKPWYCPQTEEYYGFTD